MRNNNGGIIRKLTGRLLRANSRRNFFIIAAVTLTAFMIASVFCIGMSTFATLEMQQRRLRGTYADITLENLTSGQREKLKTLDYVDKIGGRVELASVEEQEKLSGTNLFLMYFDKTEWDELVLPAYSDIVGAYPEKADEIMLPAWILERMDITEPTAGMEIPLSYMVKTVDDYIQCSETFILTGYYTSYMHLRTDNWDFLCISEELVKKHGKTVETDGVTDISVADNSYGMLMDYIGMLTKDLELTENQKAKTVATSFSQDTGMASFIGIMAIVVFLVLAGYLLIYNVLNISVSRDVRFYGLLKTVGATPKQLRRIVIGQVMRLCLVGIPVGLILSTLLSFIVVPMFINIAGGGSDSFSSTGVEISFSPLIYLGACLFSLLTALIGSYKPAKKASAVSPVEAAKYTGVPVKKKHAFTSSRGKPYKMALRNIFRERRRASVVFLSLFTGITAFILITALVASMDVGNFVSTYQSDFILENNTYFSRDGFTEKFDEPFRQRLASLPGLENIEYVSNGWARIKLTPEALKEYMASVMERYKELSSYYRQSSDEEVLADLIDNFTSILVGVEGKAIMELNESREEKIDIDAFERGEFVLVALEEPERLKDIDTLELIGDSVTINAAIGGFVPTFFRNYSSSVGPTLIVSHLFMEKLTGENIIRTIYIDVADGYDEGALEALKTMMDGDYSMSRTSRLEARAEMEEFKMTGYILGGGISVILALIGVMNFINTMSVGVMTRKHELATLESVGMSGKQVRRMLVDEGICYAVITLILVLTAGNAITYGMYTLFKKAATYAVFTYPFIPLGIIFAVVLMICVITPGVIHRLMNKQTLVERLREAE